MCEINANRALEARPAPGPNLRGKKKVTGSTSRLALHDRSADRCEIAGEYVLCVPPCKDIVPLREATEDGSLTAAGVSNRLMRYFATALSSLVLSSDLLVCSLWPVIAKYALFLHQQNL